MKQCDPDEKCEECARPFTIDMEKNLYGAYCTPCYHVHLACVMAFFATLYEADAAKWEQSCHYWEGQFLDGC